MLHKKPRNCAASDFCDKMSLRLNKEQEAIREATAALPGAGMMSTAGVGQLLANFLRMINARHVIEIGVFTGYGTLSMAQALPDDGKIVACDISEEYIAVGRPFWKQAEVEHKIDLRIAPAVKTLQSLVDSGRKGTFDFAFIDADKENYENYFELCLSLVRSGGVIAIDNVFMFGAALLDPSEVSEDVKLFTEGIAVLNEKLRTDQRVNISMINISDGLTIVVKN